MIDVLNNEFTDNEQRWYIANLYMYMNYNSTDEFPIDLENVFKLIGFLHKKNAKSTLENKFTDGEHYIIKLLPTKDNQWGGGSGKEQIMLSIDTFKTLCMFAKTPQGKEIRKYYLKMENIYNKIISEEISENEIKMKQKDQLLKEKENLLVQSNIDAIQDREKRYEQMYPEGTQVCYLGKIKQQSTIGEELVSFGKTNNISRRLKEHKHTYGSYELLFVYKCNNNTNIENEIVNFQKTHRASILKNESLRKKTNRLRIIQIDGKGSNSFLII